MPSKEEEQRDLDSVDTKNLGKAALAEEALKRATRITLNCNKFKQPRLDRIQLYRDLYAGKVKRRYRQIFNVVLPVFSGAMDTLQADFNDDLALEFGEQEPADYIAVRKLNALWNMEVGSLSPNASFAHKTRTDRANALMSGRGFMMSYGVSEPDYRHMFEVYELEDAIFQPRGGGLIENHLYQGRQNIFRTLADLQHPDIYDKAQVAELATLVKGGSNDHYPPGIDDEADRTALAKFRAAGLNPETDDYLGDPSFQLVEMALTMKGERWYIVFSPAYNKWVRFDKLKDVFSTEQYPATSWATHEDNKNFLSKSYADDMFGVAEATHVLVNQELTNREKRNFGARGYDAQMYPDVQKLDEAQYRPDALVPVTVPAGKSIKDGIFTFDTPELRGTIDLTEWMLAHTGRNIGVTDLSQGNVQNVSKKATVVFAEQQNISKRLLLRSSPYTEAMGRIGKLFMQACKDHLPAEKALKRLGIEGEGWDAAIRRTDLDLYGDVDVRIKSSAIEMRNSQLKKDARVKVLDSIAADPNQAKEVNPRWLVQEKLRSIAEFDDAEVKIAMDTENYGNKEEVARAHEGIQEIQAGRTPDLFYGATTLFMRIVHDFAVNNRTTLGNRKYAALIDYEMAHAQIAEENMLRLARKEAMTAGAAPAPEDPTMPPPAEPSPVDPMAAIRSAAAQV